MAADIPVKAPVVAPVMAPAVYNWSGFYIGGNIGGGWANADYLNTANTTSFGDVAGAPAFSHNMSGFIGGGQIGYNFQSGAFVFGAEADLQGSGAEDTFAAWKFSNPWFGTVRGRAGYAMNNVLAYATGGLAYGGGRVDFGALSETQTHLGWTVGAGVEVGLTPNWTAKAEYLYVRLEDRGYVLTGVNNGFQSNIFRLGVNYRF